MQIEISCTNFTLAPDGLLTVQDAVGTRIVCRSGVLWVTQEGDVKDTIVGPFEVLTIRKPGRTVITALESSTLTLMERDASFAGATRCSHAHRVRRMQLKGGDWIASSPGWFVRRLTTNHQSPVTNQRRPTRTTSPIPPTEPGG